jgi:hypothetical protein
MRRLRIPDFAVLHPGYSACYLQNYTRMMRIIALDGQYWRTGADFYRALLAGLGAPKDHGRNLNAVIDSVFGEE